MKKITLVLTISFCFLFACDDDELETLDLTVENFSIQLPSGWSVNEEQGYDSIIRDIVTTDNQNIELDLGWYSSNLPVNEDTHKITMTIIDDRDAKIVRPLTAENGVTGVYFADIDGQGTKLQMSGYDLTESNQKLLLEAIKTITFE